jgi:polar amino acid transport system substrate-binding protein
VPRLPLSARTRRRLAPIGPLLLAATAVASSVALLSVRGALAAPAPTAEASAASAPRASDVVGTAARTGQLVMGAPTDLPPLVFRDASGQWLGYAVDIGRAIAAEITMAVGRPVQLTVQPTPTAQALIGGVADGSLQLVCGVPFTWEGDTRVDYSLPIAVSGLRLLTPAGRLDGSPDSLRGRRIGLVEDSLAATELQGIQPAAQAVPFPSLAAAFRALRAGQLEGVIGDGSLLAGLAKTNGARDLALVPEEPYEVYAVSCMLPENDSIFRNLVNLAIARRLQAYVDGDPRVVAAVHRWVGPGGMRELSPEQIRSVYEMVLSTVEKLRPLPATPPTN